MIPFCIDQGVGVLPWSPLARGLLAGKRRTKTVRAGTDSYGHQLYGEQLSEADGLVIDTLEAVASDEAISPAQLALAWLVQKPAVVAPIIGVSKSGQLGDALAALEMSLPTGVVRRLEESYITHRVAGI